MADFDEIRGNAVDKAFPTPGFTVPADAPRDLAPPIIGSDATFSAPPTAPTPAAPAPHDELRSTAIAVPGGRLATLFQQAGVDVSADEMAALEQLGDGAFKQAMILRAQRRHGADVPVLAGPGVAGAPSEVIEATAKRLQGGAQPATPTPGRALPPLDIPKIQE